MRFDNKFIFFINNYTFSQKNINIINQKLSSQFTGN